MKANNTVGSMLGILAVLTLGTGAASNESPDGLPQGSAVNCGNPVSDPGDYHVVHAIWLRPRWVAPGHVPRDSKIWI
jgi:hypothetical protein